MAKNRTMAIKHAKARRMAGAEARNREYDRRSEEHTSELQSRI